MPNATDNLGGQPRAKLMVKTDIQERGEAGAETVKLPPSVRWAVAILSLSTLMPSVDTGIANVGLPTLAQAFSTSFQEVQWIVNKFEFGVHP